MNNYSWLQKKLHQLVLSYNFIRETSFDVENYIVSADKTNDDHVFVAGLARSGTTVLMNALYGSKKFSSLSYEDMPFILAPNIWSKLNFYKKDVSSIERAHGDGIKISTDSPEAFEEVFWMTLQKGDRDIKKDFKNYVDLINHKYKKKRYLSKNNQNVRRLELISNIFPNSKILIPFRHPLQHSYSLLSQHKRFIDNSKDDIFISSYMKWIGHTEFGPNYIPIHNKNLKFKNYLDINHWLEQWLLTYKKCCEILRVKKNIHFICYEKLCSSRDYWIDILQLLNIEDKYDFKFKNSYKEFSIEIDSRISKKALSLHKELFQLNITN